MLEAQVPHHVSCSPNPKVCSRRSSGLDLVGKLSFSLPLLGRCYSCCKALYFMKQSLIFPQTIASNSFYLLGEYANCSPHSQDLLRSNPPLHRDCIYFKNGFVVLDCLIKHYLVNLTFSYFCLGSSSTIPHPLSMLMRIH